MPAQVISQTVNVGDQERGRLNPRSSLVRALGAWCLIGLLCACSTTNKLVESKATLWKVKGDHNTMYLLGSVHVLSKDAYPLKPALEHAFDDANQVVFEIDLTRFTAERFRQEFKRTALYPSGQSLLKRLSPATIALLRSVLPNYGLTLDKVERFKPWFLAEWLSSRALEMAGFSDRLGVDFYFYHKAKAAGKPVLGLETLRDQAEIFDSFNDQENEFYLVSTISGLPAYAVMVRRLVDAWKDGNVRLLDQLLNQDKRSDPMTHAVLFSKRNSKWIPEIERFAHESGNYLIIVGAGHLVGDDGVVAQLKRAGYSVKQL
jgi:uncharacterized protein